jgi:hypothetical protein
MTEAFGSYKPRRLDCSGGVGVGYASIPAFGAAFRQTFDITLAMAKTHSL